MNVVVIITITIVIINAKKKKKANISERLLLFKRQLVKISDRRHDIITKHSHSLGLSAVISSKPAHISKYTSASTVQMRMAS